MSLGLAAAILVGGLFLLLLSGIEIFLAFGIIGSIGFFLIVHEAQNQLAWTTWVTLNVSTLTAVPLFVFMGGMFASTGIVRYLFSGAEKWLGVLPGGLACSVYGANALFGAMCGSSVAAAATFGKIAYPEMERKGYAPSLSLGVIAVGGTLSVLIPPSLIMIVYGAWENQSVARLFAGGILPGIGLSLLLIVTVIVMVTLNPKLAPKPSHYTWRDRLYAIAELLPWISVIAIVLGVIMAGVMTPTEAASLGAFLSILLPALYRRLTFKAIRSSLLEAVRVTAMVGLVMSMASVLAHIVIGSGINKAVSNFVIALPIGRYGILIAIYLMYLVLGCFFDSISMLVLTMPFIAPTISSIGFSALWFGVTYVLLAEIGCITPPFGLNLFVLKSVLPQFSLMTVARASMPFMIPIVVMLALLTIFPQIVLWLPNVMY